LRRCAIFRSALNRGNELVYILPIAMMPWVFAHSKDTRINTNQLKANTVEISDVFWK